MIVVGSATECVCAWSIDDESSITKRDIYPFSTFIVLFSKKACFNGRSQATQKLISLDDPRGRYNYKVTQKITNTAN